MHKPKKKPTKEDLNQAAFRLVQEATQNHELKPSKQGIRQMMSFMGRIGGLKGGKARAASLSAERRKEIAKKAAEKRWQKNERANQ